MKEKLNWTTESQISLTRYVNYYNKKEEQKMKINWKQVWEIIKSILIALLTADSIRNL